MPDICNITPAQLMQTVCQSAEFALGAATRKKIVAQISFVKVRRGAKLCLTVGIAARVRLRAILAVGATFAHASADQ